MAPPPHRVRTLKSDLLRACPCPVLADRKYTFAESAASASIKQECRGNRWSRRLRRCAGPPGPPTHLTRFLSLRTRVAGERNVAEIRSRTLLITTPGTRDGKPKGNLGTAAPPRSSAASSKRVPAGEDYAWSWSARRADAAR